MGHIDPHNARDMSWRAAQRAFERGPHDPEKMQSMDSLSALKSWYCARCSVYGAPIIAYSTSTAAPVCAGGGELL